MVWTKTSALDQEPKHHCSYQRETHKTEAGSNGGDSAFSSVLYCIYFVQEQLTGPSLCQNKQYIIVYLLLGKQDSQQVKHNTAYTTIKVEQTA